MVRFSIVLLVAVMFLAIAPHSAAVTCQPAGNTIYGPTTNSFDYIENRDPVVSSDSTPTVDCWGLFNATGQLGGTTVADPMVCGFYPQWYPNHFQFNAGTNYGAEVSQTFTIPATDTTFTGYSLVYFIDFIDPHHDGGSDQLNVQVWDNTTFRILISDHYDGSQPDLNCVRREPLRFSGNLAGHSITVRFLASRAYSDTHIRVSLIQFWGS